MSTHCFPEEKTDFANTRKSVLSAGAPEANEALRKRGDKGSS